MVIPTTTTPHTTPPATAPAGAGEPLALVGSALRTSRQPEFQDKVGFCI